MNPFRQRALIVPILSAIGVSICQSGEQGIVDVMRCVQLCRHPNCLESYKVWDQMKDIRKILRLNYAAPMTLGFHLHLQ